MGETWQEFAERQSDYAAKLDRENAQLRDRLAAVERERDEIMSQLTDYTQEVLALRSQLAALAEAREERDAVIAACRGTQMSNAGIASVNKMAKQVASMRSIVDAAAALDRAATTERLNPDDVAKKYAALHIALDHARTGEGK